MGLEGGVDGSWGEESQNGVFQPFAMVIAYSTPKIAPQIRNAGRFCHPPFSGVLGLFRVGVGELFSFPGSTL